MCLLLWLWRFVVFGTWDLGVFKTVSFGSVVCWVLVGFLGIVVCVCVCVCVCACAFVSFQFDSFCCLGGRRGSV